MALRPGDTFDRYRIESLIGEGGMGRVFAAHDTRLHRKVALKVLRKDQADGATEPRTSRDPAARLVREARAAAALDHPNAVSVFDVGEIDDTLYVAMELVSGKTLRAFIGEPGVPWELRLRWMVDAARALAAAHERGLVHRDVKPENIMIRKDGVVKVLDFGIAKRLPREIEQRLHPGSSDDGGASHPTAVGPIVGTPRYLSPEQVRGEPVDGRADQFAWGVVAYELLTGTPPFRPEARGGELLTAILTVPAPPLATLSPELPSLVDATIMKTLSKSPADRFASLSFVVSTLEQFVAASSRRGHVEVAVPSAAFKTEPAPPPSAARVAPAAPLLPRIEQVTDPTVPAEPFAYPPPHGTPWTRPAFALAAASTLAAGLALIIVVARTPPRRVAEGEDSAPAPVAAPTAVTDLVPPPGVAPDARAAFVAFAQSFRDGDVDAARASLVRATTADPTFAAAHLRLAFLESLVSADEAEVARAYKRAVQYRALLSPRDTLLLDAFAPYFQAEPSDPAECERRLRHAFDAYPLDAELAYYLASVRFDRGDLTGTLAALDRAIAIDPQFAQAYATQAGAQAYSGAEDAALASIHRCLDVSSGATECLWYAAQIHEQSGACAAMEEDTRAWVSKDQDDYFAYQWLAKALYGEGKPLEVVRTALEQKWVRVAPARRARLEALDGIRLDLLSGDFASAEAKALGLEKDLAPEPGALAHAESHKLLVATYTEEGKADAAAKVAGSFLARKDAWLTPHRVDDRAIWEDAVPAMLAAELAAGEITKDDLAARRGAWLTAWRAKTSGAYQSYLWIYGYAVPANDAAGARDALAALPGFAPLPPFTPQSIAPAHVGKAYLLAGKIDEAIPYLRAATASCTALDEPIAHTRASLHLGMALEAKGDVAGACAAYRVVLSRWGSAKPKSTSADAARARALLLACPK